jgi:tryptophan-rich sensory protein
MRLFLQILKIVLMVAVCAGSGAAGTAIAGPSSFQWYGELVQPPLSPPSWVFGVAWAILYLLMGIAAGWIWNNAAFLPKARTTLILFLLHLILTILWVVLFFGYRLAGWALAEIIILWAVILMIEILFYAQSKAAGILLWPYLGWVTFAVYLNAGVWILNR